eukprot:Lithocolla_globosa_v1_NODE_4333_length_1460_cov_23.298221.p2 type:complete len:148 gc:universal NODE_4333_length_1460_cov_23.298221:805-362(-)
MTQQTQPTIGQFRFYPLSPKSLNAYHTRVVSFFEDNNLLYKRQYGFRKNRSTSIALINFYEMLARKLDQGNLGLGIFIDLKKAFDTVNHHILIEKLRHYGIRGTALSWIQSYLHKRTQFVQMGGKKSKREEISCGVPKDPSLARYYS